MAAQLPEPGDPDALYVMDLSGYVFRAYHGMNPLSNSKGEPTHATLGVTNMLNALVRAQRPAYLAVAMDSLADTFRHGLYPAYKANRPPPPPDLAQQLARCREVAEAYAIPVLQRDGFEADDLLATCVRVARAHRLKVVVASGDKDLLALVGDGVVVWDAMRQKVYGPDEVREKWGVGPERVRDLLALMGDSSDNVPGVEHVGEKTAAKLLTDFGSLAGVYANLDKVKGKTREYLTLHEKDARLSYELVGLKDDVPMAFDLEALRYGGWDKARLKALLLDLEFHKLAATVDAGTTAPGVAVASASAEYLSVLREEDLDAAITACRAAGSFALDTETTGTDASQAELVGISLAWRGGFGVYIPVGHKVLTDPRQLPRALVLERLRPLLGDPAVRKVGQNLKFDAVVLAQAGCPVHGYDFDTMLASYLLDPEKPHNLDELARRELGYTMLSFAEVAGTGKKQVTFDHVDIARATRYSAEDAEVTWRLAERLRPRIDAEGLGRLLTEVEVPLAHVLGRMETAGVLLDRDRLKKLQGHLGAELVRLEAACHAAAGRTFNVHAPRQLETILFDDLKLPVTRRTKTARSTDAEVLEELSAKHPLPGKVLELRALAKLQSTYVETLPSQVGRDGRIHTSFNQAVAATGRLSSSNPNLQNIPVRTPLGRELRDAFIAPPGHRLLSADYSQIELRVLASLSHDPILVDAFTHATDVHVRTAMEVFKVPKEAVTRDLRARAKTVNFAVIYGQGEGSLARQLGIPREEAAAFIQHYFATFATLRKYLDDSLDRARAASNVVTLLGRRRFINDLHSSNRALRLAAERMAQNTPIQGTAADIIKVAMVAVDRRLTAERLRARMLLTVHDELVLEVPDDEAPAVEALVRETMEGAMKLDVPLVVECGWGHTWGEAH